MSVRAVVLAAGRGSRLGPASTDRPKALVEVAGTTILRHQRDAFAATGITDVHLVAGHGLELVRAHADVRGLTLHVNRDWAATNMVATLACARSAMIGDADIIVSYGDIVFEPRLLRALADASDAEVGVVVDLDWERYWRARMDDPLADAETLRVDPNGRLLEIGAPPSRIEDVEAQYIGLIRIRADAAPRVISRWADLRDDELIRGRTRGALHMTDLLQLLVDEGWDVRAARVRSGWLEFDRPSDLLLERSSFWQRSSTEAAS